VMSRLHRGRKSLQKQLYEFATSRGLTARSSTADGAPGEDGELDAPREPARTGPTRKDDV
jgi:hypothetical protein